MHAARRPDGAVQAPQRSRTVALDIGTHGSGCGVRKVKPCIKPGRNDAPHLSEPVKMIEDWPEQPTRYPKSRSAVLYKDRTPVAWGWEAYSKLSKLTPDEQDSYRLVEDFKLALEDKEMAGNLRAMGLSPEQVMTDYLKPFTVYIKKQLRAGGMAPEELDNIQWVLSVPPVWSEESKALMRRAAFRAGITRQRDDPALMFVSEPEAAALHAMETNAPPLVPGMTVCVLDVGGGTADMTVHEVEERGGQAVLAEMLFTVGALCGGARVDQAFRCLYRERVGAEAYDQWVQEHKAEALQVNEKWLALKHSWSSDSSQLAALDLDDAVHDLMVHRVFIPPHLHARMSLSSRTSLAMQQHGINTDVLFSGKDMKQLFDTSINTITAMAQDHLRLLRAPCSVVILVGGFAASPYFQARMRRALVQDEHLAEQVVVPPFPYAAVMQGSAIYGCCPELIRARRTRMAYGIKQCAPYMDGAPGKFFNEEEACFWTDSLFASFVYKGQQVECDEEVTHYVVPLDHKQREARIQLHTTDKNETRFITDNDPDMRCLGELVLDLPDMESDQELPTLCVKLKFGRAELQARAIDIATGKEQRATFHFAPAA